HPVAVRVGERAGVDLVDDGVAPPLPLGAALPLGGLRSGQGRSGHGESFRWYRWCGALSQYVAQPFTAPAVEPATMYRCRNWWRMITWSITMTDTEAKTPRLIERSDASIP